MQALSAGQLGCIGFGRREPASRTLTTEWRRSRQRLIVLSTSPERSGSDPDLADTGHLSKSLRRGVLRMKKLYVRMAAIAASLVGLLLAGGAGFGFGK
jgi:hypothetical protein